MAKNYGDPEQPDHDLIWRSPLHGPYKCICGKDMRSLDEVDAHLSGEDGES